VCRLSTNLPAKPSLHPDQPVLPLATPPTQTSTCARKNHLIIVNGFWLLARFPYVVLLLIICGDCRPSRKRRSFICASNKGEVWVITNNAALNRRWYQDREINGITTILTTRSKEVTPGKWNRTSRIDQSLWGTFTQRRVCKTRNNRPENKVLAATPPIQNAVKTLTQRSMRPSQS